MTKQKKGGKKKKSEFIGSGLTHVEVFCCGILALKCQGMHCKAAEREGEEEEEEKTPPPHLSSLRLQPRAPSLHSSPLHSSPHPEKVLAERTRRLNVSKLIMDSPN